MKIVHPNSGEASLGAVDRGAPDRRASGPLPFRDSSVKLSDGRRLGYAEFGVPDGEPLLWFPGLPGCCRYAHPGDLEVIHRARAQLICVERPGFGISDFSPGRTLLDYARDVRELADALELDRFCIAGVSAGGPALAACAHELPDRIAALGMIGCGGPSEVQGATDGMAKERKRFVGLFRHSPRLAAALMRALGLHRKPERLFEMIVKGLDPSDLKRIREPHAWTSRMQNVREAMRQGPMGFAWEVHMLVKPWGFSVADIRIPVELWHGQLDRTTPIAMGQYLDEHIPNCNARFIADEGHFLCDDRFEEILLATTAHLTAPRPGETAKVGGT
jgi:pimeloyl-ACP methyl ester carboxylesterase